ncbi:MAG: replicative DNA helicase [Planctomycetes bacterium]|nr:replicative DNA helicase [Planctomycetota bacterium]MBZ0151094.1 replicative DNA helicase [Planctomycetota bacterium]MCC7398388.1 replicative DNA helicase [Planctomycetota bacterium]
MVDFKQTFDGRGVPQNLEAERSVLGALLLHADTVGDVMFLKPEDFYLARHQVIFQSILDAYNTKQATDPIVVGEALSRVGRLDEAGGHGQLLDLMESVVTSAGVVYHAEIVREKAIQRRLLETCLDVARRAYDNESDAKDLLDEAERQIFEISRLDKSGDAVSIANVLQSTFERIDRLREREGRLTGLGTDFYDFDDMTGGLQAGELIIVAARPSMGKTTFALNLTERVANGGASVAFFSLEMSSQQVIQNMLCNRAQIDGQAMRKGRITDQQYKRLQDEAARLYETPIFVDDTPGISITQLRAKCRRLKQRHNINMCVVDYLQLMSGGGRFESRQQEISAISRGLKSLARELSMPVIALSQLNRDVENRDDHRPRMSDLRESGAIEQDADVIVLLHRDDYYKPTEQNAGLAQIIIAKQRNGPTGEVVLRFFREYMRFENYTRRAEPMQ